jgi:hypothetical protein
VIPALLYLCGMIMARSYGAYIMNNEARFDRFSHMERTIAVWIGSALWVMFAVGFLIRELTLATRRVTWPR